MCVLESNGEEARVLYARATHGHVALFMNRCLLSVSKLLKQFSQRDYIAFR